MASELRVQKVKAAIRKIAWSRSPGRRRSRGSVLYRYRNTLASQLTASGLSCNSSDGLALAADLLPGRLVGAQLSDLGLRVDDDVGVQRISRRVVLVISLGFEECLQRHHL